LASPLNKIILVVRLSRKLKKFVGLRQALNVISHIMKLRHYFFYLLVFALSFSATSCGQTSSHQDDLNYYTTIALQMKDIVPKVQSFWQQMKQGVLSAKQNQDQKLDKPTLDTLKGSLTKILTDLETKIKKINSLNETDKNLNLKQTVATYLEETKQLQQTAIPKVLELLENGLDKITDVQKEAVKQFSAKGQELQIKSTQIGDCP
jgi:hypothetical protein